MKNEAFLSHRPPLSPIRWNVTPICRFHNKPLLQPIWKARENRMNRDQLIHPLNLLLKRDPIELYSSFGVLNL